MDCTVCNGTRRRVVTADLAFEWLSKHPEIRVFYSETRKGILGTSHDCRLAMIRDEVETVYGSDTDGDPQKAFLGAVSRTMYNLGETCEHCKGTGKEPLPTIKDALHLFFLHNVSYTTHVDHTGCTVTFNHRNGEKKRQAYCIHSLKGIGRLLLEEAAKLRADLAKQQTTNKKENKS